MRNTFIAALALSAVALSGASHAQGFTPQELDRMSQRDNEGRKRNFGPPPPISAAPAETLHQPPGLWVCMSTDDYVPILAAPQPNARVISQSTGQVAAGADQNGYTSVLIHEGSIGYVPKSAVKPYRNQFNPRAACSFEGVRQSGLLVFKVR